MHIKGFIRCLSDLLFHFIVLWFTYQTGGVVWPTTLCRGKRCVNPLHSPTPPTFLFLFLVLFKSAYSLRILCPSVRSSEKKINSVPTGQIFVKFYIRVLHLKKKLSIKSKFGSNWTKTPATLRKDLSMFYMFYNHTSWSRE